MLKSKRVFFLINWFTPRPIISLFNLFNDHIFLLNIMSVILIPFYFNNRQLNVLPVTNTRTRIIFFRLLNFSNNFTLFHPIITSYELTLHTFHTLTPHLLHTYHTLTPHLPLTYHILTTYLLHTYYTLPTHSHLRIGNTDITLGTTSERYERFLSVNKRKRRRLLFFNLRQDKVFSWGYNYSPSYFLSIWKHIR